MGTIILADVTELETVKISELTKVSDIDTDDSLPVVRDGITSRIESLDLATPGYWRSYEPFLDENYANVKAKPAQVNRGLFKGYSFPIWNGTSNLYEELVFRLRVPFRWDGTTNPYFCAITAIQGIETVGKKYRFQLEWVSEDVGHVLPATTDEILTWEVTVANGSAWYAEIIVGEMDASLNLIAGQNWQARLRRIDITSGVEVANEPVVFHWCTRWKCDKWGTSSVMGY